MSMILSNPQEETKKDENIQIITAKEFCEKHTSLSGQIFPPK